MRKCYNFSLLSRVYSYSQRVLFLGRTAFLHSTLVNLNPSVPSDIHTRVRSLCWDVDRQLRMDPKKLFSVCRLNDITLITEIYSAVENWSRELLFLDLNSFLLRF